MEADSEGRAGAVEPCRIGVVGFTEGAGASLITACMAEYLAEGEAVTVAVAELGGGGLYGSLGLERRFALREYGSYYKACAGNGRLKGLQNIEGGVNWALKLPAEMEWVLPYREALRLIYGLREDIVLFDFSGRKDEEKWSLMKEMDRVLVIVDPLPGRLLLGQGALERMKLSGLPALYLINKQNTGVNQKELLRFLKLRSAEGLPFLAPELIYGVQYEGRRPWQKKEIREQFTPAFQRIAQKRLL